MVSYSILIYGVAQENDGFHAYGNPYWAICYRQVVVAKRSWIDVSNGIWFSLIVRWI